MQSDVRVEEQLQTIIHSARKQHSRISSLADDYRTKALDILFAIYRDSAKVCSRTLVLVRTVRAYEWLDSGL